MAAYYSEAPTKLTKHLRSRYCFGEVFISISLRQYMNHKKNLPVVVMALCLDVIGETQTIFRIKCNTNKFWLYAAVFFFFFGHFSDIVRIFCLMSEIFGVISDKVSEKLLLIARQLHGHVAAPCSLNLLKFCEFLFATKPLPL